MTSSRKLSAVVATGFVCLLGLHSVTANASSNDNDGFSRETNRQSHATQNPVDSLNGQDSDVYNPSESPAPSGSILVSLPPEMLYGVLDCLDPQSLARTREVCRLFEFCADKLMELHETYAKTGIKSSQRWLCTAFEQGSPRTLSWLRSAFEQEDTAVEKVASTFFTKGEDYAILTLFDKFGDEGRSKLEALLKNQGIIANERIAVAVEAIIAAVSTVEAGSRVSFVTHCKSLITEKMDCQGTDAAAVVRAVATFAAGDWARMAEHCKSLIRKGVNGFAIEGIFQVFATIEDRSDWASLTQDCQPLITEEMDNSEVAKLVRAEAEKYTGSK